MNDVLIDHMEFFRPTRGKVIWSSLTALITVAVYYVLPHSPYNPLDFLLFPLIVPIWFLNQLSYFLEEMLMYAGVVSYEGLKSYGALVTVKIVKGAIFTAAQLLYCYIIVALLYKRREGRKHEPRL